MRENRLHKSQNTATCPHINDERTYIFIIAGYFLWNYFLNLEPEALKLRSMTIVVVKLSPNTNTYENNWE